jgi:hypothetical protein
MSNRAFYCLLYVVFFSCHFHVDAVEHLHVHPLKSYFLPRNHPLNSSLGHLFQYSFMFRSPKYLTAAGFHVKVSHHRLMVAKHPNISNYLIKKFIDRIPRTSQLKNFIKRIRGARCLRQHIKKLGLKHIVVPHKWLYPLPKKFSSNSYVLVVEEMDVYDDWDDPNGKARELYYNMDREILTEFCMLLHAVGGCDSIPRNQPFTRSGQIAFIDTEHVGEHKGHFYKHIVPALNPELQDYAIALWKKLEQEKKE